MTKKATVNWIEGFKLEGKTHSGQVVFMDTGENAASASPSELVLQALAGCTMMDCVSILTKARKQIMEFHVDVEAEEAETIPKVFINIHLTYNFVSPNLSSNDVERAIKLSEEKYCRVHAMLAGNVKMTSSYQIKAAN
jgi:putative redox protein